MPEDKLLRMGVDLIIVASPFFYWLVLYFAGPRSQDELRTQISRIKKLRWITYNSTVAFEVLLASRPPANHHWIVGSGVLTASIGLTPMPG